MLELIRRPDWYKTRGGEYALYEDGCVIACGSKERLEKILGYETVRQAQKRGAKAPTHNELI
jgi:hypothetical protein